MAKVRDYDSKKLDKQMLGNLIKECRGNKSLRSVAYAIGLSPSNLKYIEDGVNAPSSDIYAHLIDELYPSVSMRKEMDRIYMSIRNTPPPDICGIFVANEDLNDSLRILTGQTLTSSQFQELNALLRSFEEKKYKEKCNEYTENN